MLIVLVVEAEPAALVTVKRTVCSPVVTNTWEGFWAVEVLAPEFGSPKFQSHEVGLLSDVSTNFTVVLTGAVLGWIEKCGSGTEAVVVGGGVVEPETRLTTNTLNSGPVAAGVAHPTGAAEARPLIGSAIEPPP
jgi:hypothetical protein